jgi:hypothetical protein
MYFILPQYFVQNKYVPHTNSLRPQDPRLTVWEPLV